MNRDYLNVATFHFERYGDGDPARIDAAIALLRAAGVQLLSLQGHASADTTKAFAAQARAALNLRCWRGRGYHTAVLATLDVFTCLGRQPVPRPEALFSHPPTAVALRLTEAGRGSTPIIAVSGRLSSASPTLRQVEAELLASYNQQQVDLPDGQRKRAVVIAGLDCSSYPAGHLGPPLPRISTIEDRAHRAQRTRIGPDDQRVMDQMPHRTFETAGLTDVARSLPTRQARTAAVQPTVPASPARGPASREDMLFSSHRLTDRGVWEQLEVIDAQTVSGHNLVVARALRAHLAEALSTL
ncbi:hypothetical protein ACFYWU_41135 [Streptomyces chrestomyceticus]|uniref:hypothetical protein n=1 Tax=Streptomyces chrestomyceticus TaxID=68185 RepID=UPI0036B97EAC